MIFCHAVLVAALAYTDDVYVCCKKKRANEICTFCIGALRGVPAREGDERLG
jgi:hypothetical protein